MTEPPSPLRMLLSRHTKRYLVADPERDQTIEASKGCVARRPMNNIAFAEEKARKISARPARLSRR
jgi:hypothetical protein